MTRVALVPEAHVESRFAAVATRAGRVRPDSSLPISLFVEPELLGALQDLATPLCEAWRRMASASLSRGRMPDATMLVDVLDALGRELWAASAILQGRTELARPFRLVPTSPIQSAQVRFPLDAISFFGDREPAHLRQPPIRVDLAQTRDAMFALLPRLANGIESDELAQLTSQLPGPLQEVLHRLRFASLLGPAPAPVVREVARDAVIHLGHATLLANLDGAHVLVDPWLPTPSAGDTTRPWTTAELPPIAAVLMTHHHWDHVNVDTLIRLDRAVPLYVPRQREDAVVRPQTVALLQYLGFRDVRELVAGDRIPLGANAEVIALPFYGEDPTRIAYRGLTYALRTGDAAALVHVDSGADYAGRSLADDPMLSSLGLQLDPVFATRRQERGFMIEHTWEFLFREIHEWVQPTENCCNDAAALAHLAAVSKTPRLVLYSEGGADWYPPGTDFLRGASDRARTRPFEFLADSLDVITERVRAAGAEVVLSRPFDTFSIGSR
ncbi:MAG: MBL fold metallo-hydrolase [Kofleriaceae bacterium]